MLENTAIYPRAKSKWRTYSDPNLGELTKRLTEQFPDGTIIQAAGRDEIEVPRNYVTIRFSVRFNYGKG